MDNTETIKYKITFPDGDVNTPFDEHKLTLVEKALQKRVPVVILLGWAGCTEKHLSKYSAVYEQRSLITIQYIAPTKYLFFGGAEKLKNFSKQLLDVLFEYSLEENPLFFHIMSNGGGVIYNNITTWIHSSEKYSKLQIRGCIFDSCPGKRRILKAVKAYMTSLRVNFLLKYLLGLCLLFILVAMKIITKLFHCFKNMAKSFVLFDELAQDESRCPQLFLFSHKDNVILSCDIEEFIAQRLMRGVKVYRMCWDDTDHVAHLITHREAYIKQCHDFINTCLHQ